MSYMKMLYMLKIEEDGEPEPIQGDYPEDFA